MSAGIRTFAVGRPRDGKSQGLALRPWFGSVVQGVELACVSIAAPCYHV